jgi:hypothetical protein
MFDTYKEIFDNRAESYRTGMRGFPQARKEEFYWAVKYLHISPGDTICDVPSGGGYLRDFISKPDSYFYFLETCENFASYNINCSKSITQVC